MIRADVTSFRTFVGRILTAAALMIVGIGTATPVHADDPAPDAAALALPKFNFHVRSFGNVEGWETDPNGPPQTPEIIAGDHLDADHNICIGGTVHWAMRGRPTSGDGVRVIDQLNERAGPFVPGRFCLTYYTGIQIINVATRQTRLGCAKINLLNREVAAGVTYDLPFAVAKPLNGRDVCA
jgi:hypothetical protein